MTFALIGRSICGGVRNSRSCPSPTVVAGTNSPEECFRAPATTPLIAAIARNIRNSQCCLRPGMSALSASITRSDRYYHRGHTWVKPEEDGTVTVGLDELASHLVGTPDSVNLPEVGQKIELNQTAWRMKKNGREIEVRAPIEGTIWRWWRQDKAGI